MVRQGGRVAAITESFTGKPNLLATVVEWLEKKAV